MVQILIWVSRLEFFKIISKVKLVFKVEFIINCPVTLIHIWLIHESIELINIGQCLIHECLSLVLGLLIE